MVICQRSNAFTLRDRSARNHATRSLRHHIHTRDHLIRSFMCRMSGKETEGDMPLSVAQPVTRTGVDLSLLHMPVAMGEKMYERRACPLGAVWFPHERLPVIRAGILSAFRKAGCEANVVQHANRSLTVLACVAAGCCASLLLQRAHQSARPRRSRAMISEAATLSTLKVGQSELAHTVLVHWWHLSVPVRNDWYAQAVLKLDVEALAQINDEAA